MMHFKDEAAKNTAILDAIEDKLRVSTRFCIHYSLFLNESGDIDIPASVLSILAKENIIVFGEDSRMVSELSERFVASSPIRSSDRYLLLGGNAKE